MNIAPPKEAHLDLGRTLNHMLLWLAPEHVTGGSKAPAFGFTTRRDPYIGQQPLAELSQGTRAERFPGLWAYPIITSSDVR
jgi:hypothetical protein